MTTGMRQHRAMVLTIKHDAKRAESRTRPLEPITFSGDFVRRLLSEIRVKS